MKITIYHNSYIKPQLKSYKVIHRLYCKFLMVFQGLNPKGLGLLGVNMCNNQRQQWIILLWTNMHPFLALQFKTRTWTSSFPCPLPKSSANTLFLCQELLFPNLLGLKKRFQIYSVIKMRWNWNHQEANRAFRKFRYILKRYDWSERRHAIFRAFLSNIGSRRAGNPHEISENILLDNFDIASASKGQSE